MKALAALALTLLLSAIAIIAIIVAAPPAAFAQEDEPPPPGPGPEPGPPAEDPYGDIKVYDVPKGGVEVNVEDLLRITGETLKRVVTIDPAIRGQKIKFYTSGELNFRMLTEILSIYGIQITIKTIEGRDLIETFLTRSLPTATISVPAFIPEGGALPESEQIVTAVYRVKYANAGEVHAAIRSLMTRDPRRVGEVVFVQRSEVLIIKDLMSNVQFYLKIAGALDQETPSFTYKLVRIEYADARELAALVNQLTRIQETGVTAGAPGQPGPPARAGAGAAGGASGQPQVVADIRTNKVVILALPADIEAIEQLLKELDTKEEAPPKHFHVVPLKNSNAEEIADKLNQLFTGQGTGFTSTRQQTRSRTGSGTAGRSPSLGGRTGRDELLRRQGLDVGAAQPQPTATRTGAAIGGVPQPGDLNPALAEIPTRVIADPQTNSLLIQAGPEDFREIQNLLKELDKKRLRVLIEAQVYEISVTDDWFFAVELATADDASTNTEPDPFRGHGGTAFNLSEITANDDFTQVGRFPNAVTLARGGLIAILTKGAFDQLPLIVQAVANDNDTDVQTTPFAVTNDNEPATFTVEQNEPFQVATSTSVSAFQGFDFATATSELSITPRISSESTLTLAIDLQIQTFTGQAIGGAPPPSNSRSYSGTVTVPNREYIVFGGFEQEAIAFTRKKIPLLGDIPLLGYLFSSTGERKSRTRLFIFVRPIIFADEDFDREKKAGDWAWDRIRALSKHDPEHSLPVIPVSVLDAEAPGRQAILHGIYGDGGLTAFPETERTRAARRAAAEAK